MYPLGIPAHAMEEATELAHIYGERARMEKHCNIQNLDCLLEGMTVWYFAGHGDFALGSDLVPIFGCEPQVVSPDAICQILKKHAQRSLRLVVLNGCKVRAHGTMDV